MLNIYFGDMEQAVLIQLYILKILMKMHGLQKNYREK